MYVHLILSGGQPSTVYIQLDNGTFIPYTESEYYNLNKSNCQNLDTPSTPGDSGNYCL